MARLDSATDARNESKTATAPTAALWRFTRENPVSVGPGNDGWQRDHYGPKHQHCLG